MLLYSACFAVIKVAQGMTHLKSSLDIDFPEVRSTTGNGVDMSRCLGVAVTGTGATPTMSNAAVNQTRISIPSSQTHINGRISE